jgi:hypothetical protein
MPTGHQNPAIDAMVARLVKAFPDHPARSLARKLVEETNGALTLEAARTRIRTVFGVHCKDRRKYAKAPRPPRQPGQTVAMPKSWAEPWTPHVLEVVGRVGILSDVHVPYHDEIALRAAVDRLAGERIDALVLNGDCADFYGISRWEKDPSKRDFKGELQAVDHGREAPGVARARAAEGIGGAGQRRARGVFADARLRPGRPLPPVERPRGKRYVARGDVLLEHRLSL